MAVKWRIPTDVDFMKLEIYLGMDMDESYDNLLTNRSSGSVGGQLSLITPLGTDSSGFNAKVGGYQGNTAYYAATTASAFLTSTYTPTTNYPCHRVITTSSEELLRYTQAYTKSNFACPVRLVRDLISGEESLADGAAATDYTGNDGQVYPTVRIGFQVWMSENLIETKYYNAEDITHADITNWGSVTTATRGYPENNIDKAYTDSGGTKTIGYGFIYNQLVLDDPRLLQNNTDAGTEATFTTYTVTYSLAEERYGTLANRQPGYVYGSSDTIDEGTTQTVPSGDCSWAVEVTPAPYIYEFDQWNDGILTESRLERNVTSNQSYTASATLTAKEWRAPEATDWTNLFSHIPGGILMAGYHLASHLGNTYNFDMKQAGGVTGNPGTAPVNFGTAAFMWSGVRNVGTYSFYVLQSSSNNQMSDTLYSYSNRLYSVRLCRDLYYEEMFFWEDGEYLDDYVGNDGQTYKVVKIGDLAWTAEHSIETKDKNNVDLVDWNSPDADINNAYTETGGVKTINYGLLHSWVELHGEKGAGIANDTYTPTVSEGDRFSKEAASTLRTDDSYLEYAVSRAPLEVDDTNGDMAMGEENIVFLFQKDTQAASPSAFNITWKGESTIAPSSKPVVLQVYNHTSSSWETLDTDNTTAADIQVVLTANVTTNLANYYDADNFISVRVYQDVST